MSLLGVRRHAGRLQAIMDRQGPSENNILDAMADIGKIIVSIILLLRPSNKYNRTSTYPFHGYVFFNSSFYSKPNSGD